jgi:hypothetical protein
MKSVGISILAVLVAFATACGSSGSGTTPQGNSTSIAGYWSVNTIDKTDGLQSALQATLVSSACTASTPIGTFTVQGPSCFLADNNTGQGSVSGTGSLIYPPQGVLVGVAANPAPANSPLNLFFVEADQFGDAAIFVGNGTVTNGTMTGTWSCSPNSPVCLGLNGTFSGTKGQAPALAITATSGTPQGAGINEAFPLPIVATVTTGGTPTASITVTFTAVPAANGASCTFANGTATDTETTDVNGEATSSLVIANLTTGTYTVTASATGATTPASFILTNQPVP